MPPKRKAAAEKPTKVLEESEVEEVPAVKVRRGRETTKKVADSVAEPKTKKIKEKAVKKPTETEVPEEVMEKAKGRQRKKVLPKETDEETEKPRSARIKKNAEKSDASKKAKTTKEEDDDSEDESKNKKPKNGRTKKAADKAVPKTQKAKKKDDEEKPSGLSNNSITKWDKIDFKCSTKNSNGDMYNFKVTSWNIGGLKSWIKKDCIKFIEHEDPDVICFQETKCSEDKLPDEMKNLKGYNQYWCSSQKEGYAGVGLLTKVAPINVTYGIEVPDLDEDGRCITAEYDDYYIVGVYVPNAGRKLVTLPKRLEWNEEFKKYIKALDEKKPVIICGDMNVSHNEIDLARPKNNTKNAGFTQEERDGMTDFLEDGYVDTFRILYPDKADIYTFWTYMSNARAKNVGWRLDYFIVSEKIMKNVCDNVIRNEVFGSDHCPITLFLNI